MGRVLLGLVIVLLVAVAWSGFWNGIKQLTLSRTSGEWLQTAMQLVYGLMSLLTVLTVFRRGAATRWIRFGFVLSTGAAAGIAAVVWGGSGLRAGLAAGVGTALVCWGVVWLLGVALTLPKSSNSAAD